MSIDPVIQYVYYALEFILIVIFISLHGYYFQGSKNNV